MLTNKSFTRCLLFILLGWGRLVYAGPWVDADDFWTLADIERLSQAGVISVPLMTYPIMWAGILKDLDSISIDLVPQELKSAYWRVKRNARQALSLQSQGTLSFQSATLLNRGQFFSSASLSESEVIATTSSMTNNFAWNIQVHQLFGEAYGEDISFKGSYLAFVHGNWVYSLEKSGQNSSHYWSGLSLPEVKPESPWALSLVRNYANPGRFDDVAFSWPFSLRFSLGLLDDKNSFADGRYFQLSSSFKPWQQLELAFQIRDSRFDDGQFNLCHDRYFSHGVLICANSPLEKNWIPLNDSVAQELAIQFSPWAKKQLNLFAHAGEYESALMLPEYKAQEWGAEGHFLFKQKNWRWQIKTSRDFENFCNSWGAEFEENLSQCRLRFQSQLSLFGALTSDWSVDLRLTKGELKSFALAEMKESGYIEWQSLEPEKFNKTNLKKIELSTQYQVNSLGKLKLEIGYLKLDKSKFINADQNYLKLTWVSLIN